MTTEEFQQQVLKKFEQNDRFQEEVMARFEQIDQRFDALDCKIDCFRDEMNGRFASLTLNLIRSGSLESVHVEATTAQG